MSWGRTLTLSQLSASGGLSYCGQETLTFGQLLESPQPCRYLANLCHIFKGIQTGRFIIAQKALYRALKSYTGPKAIVKCQGNSSNVSLLMYLPFLHHRLS